jgi:hypothetical protein
MCLLRPQYLEEYFPLLSQKKQKNIFKRVTVNIFFNERFLRLFLELCNGYVIGLVVWHVSGI